MHNTPSFSTLQTLKGHRRLTTLLPAAVRQKKHFVPAEGACRKPGGASPQRSQQDPGPASRPALPAAQLQPPGACSRRGHGRAAPQGPAAPRRPGARRDLAAGPGQGGPGAEGRPRSALRRGCPGPSLPGPVAGLGPEPPEPPAASPGGRRRPPAPGRALTGDTARTAGSSSAAQPPPPRRPAAALTGRAGPTPPGRRRCRRRLRPPPPSSRAGPRGGAGGEGPGTALRPGTGRTGRRRSCNRSRRRFWCGCGCRRRTAPTRPVPSPPPLRALPPRRPHFRARPRRHFRRRHRQSLPRASPPLLPLRGGRRLAAPLLWQPPQGRGPSGLSPWQPRRRPSAAPDRAGGELEALPRADISRLSVRARTGLAYSCLATGFGPKLGRAWGSASIPPLRGLLPAEWEQTGQHWANWGCSHLPRACSGVQGLHPIPSSASAKPFHLFPPL